MSSAELHGLFDRRIKQLIGEIKAVCYDRSRKTKDMVAGAKSYAECVDRNMNELQRFESFGRLRIIYTEMLTDRARTDD
jgi:hypothetical protein